MLLQKQIRRGALIKMNKKTREFLLKWFYRLERRNVLNVLSDKLYLKLLFYLKMNKKLNLKKPETFNEKLQWIKLYDRNPIYTIMADKFASKRFISKKIGEEYIVKLLGGPWYSFDEIDFEMLPESFVLKTNHDSGGVMLCKDKKNFDKDKARSFFEQHLNNKYYYSSREWPYKNIRPCIFAEELLDDGSGDAIYDYKFFCFNGEPKIMYLSRDKSEEPRTDFFDMEYNHLNMRMRDKNSDIPPEKPDNFEEMKCLSRKISKNIPHVRVDFYTIGEKIYLGETTFFHCGGFVSIQPKEWENILGSWIELPKDTN